ncbi:MAG: hypothetical protein D6714_13270, partial [Bacteroidetes bacterium]
SLLTELEKCTRMVFYKGATPPGLGSVFFIRPRPAPAKVGKRETCDRRQKHIEPFIFAPKK